MSAQISLKIIKVLVGAFRHPDSRAIERGVQLLIGTQQPNGDWPQVILHVYCLHVVYYICHIGCVWRRVSVTQSFNIRRINMCVFLPR